MQNLHFSNLKYDFLSNFDETLSEFHEHAPNVKNFQFLLKMDSIFRKIRENFGNVQIIQKIIQNYSVVSLLLTVRSRDELDWTGLDGTGRAGPGLEAEVRLVSLQQLEVAEGFPR